ncbi:hypothetical protein [Natronobacterium texcoconense]|uniref:DUF1102 domain-containing protein n=1 Tax=Natronobacterium texcoconense TaxID=1095778 RepID=A0A1H1IMB1_NATTX|nr:hypothetical protein [Natronobacterium texcoconense]SDR38814.1 hypothetical protein SAMN04489842_3625 [Natronobacterium texcoconense]
MDRRSVLVGLGAFATGSVVIGTGAFTQVSGERNADIAVKREDEALLQLEALDSVDYPNADIADNTGGGATLELDFNQVLEGEGHGPNVDAVVTFDDVFAVKNTGSQDVFFWAEFPEAPVYDEMGFYVDNPEPLLDGDAGAATLPVGEQVLVGVKIDSDRIAEERDDELIDVTIKATATDPTADHS